MKKQFLSGILIFSMLLSCVSVFAAEEAGTKYGDYLYYEANGDNTAVTITDCNTWADEIAVPSEIEGLPVTSIEAAAFKDCRSLKSITLPNSVTSIGKYAFKNCNGLTSITIPDSVTSIGEYAFVFCRSLKSVTILGGITSIYDDTFSYCTSLTSITIPGSVTSVGEEAFELCDSLKDIYYTGSAEQWENIETIPIGNNALKTAALHFEEAVSAPAAAAEIVRSDSAENTEYTFTVTADTAYESCYVYVLIYDVNGALTGVSCVPFVTDVTSVSAPKSTDDALTKVIVWSNTLQPLIKEFSADDM